MRCPNCKRELDTAPRVCPHCAMDIRIAKSLLGSYADHLANGINAILRQDLDHAETSLRKAIRLVDGIADAHFFLGITLGLSHRLDEAIGEFKMVPKEHRLGNESRRIMDKMTALLRLPAELGLPDERDRKAAAVQLERMSDCIERMSHLKQELSLRMLSSQDARFAHLASLADRLANLRKKSRLTHA
ncbi:MAG TPA: hypothetical protein VM163_14300 [bacterium]|nr:hypothetical protein [bacterium]